MVRVCSVYLRVGIFHISGPGNFWFLSGNFWFHLARCLIFASSVGCSGAATQLFVIGAVVAMPKQDDSPSVLALLTGAAKQAPAGKSQIGTLGRQYWMRHQIMPP